MTEQQIVTFGEIFPGFDTWYRANHDEEGRYIGQKIPGLKPPAQASPGLLRLAEEARQQIEAGEAGEGGFGGDE